MRSRILNKPAAESCRFLKCVTFSISPDIQELIFSRSLKIFSAPQKMFTHLRKTFFLAVEKFQKAIPALSCRFVKIFHKT